MDVKSECGINMDARKYVLFFFHFNLSEELKMTVLTTILQIICEPVVHMQYMTQVKVFHRQLNGDFPPPCLGVIWRRLGIFFFSLEKSSQTFRVLGLTWKLVLMWIFPVEKTYFFSDHSETTSMRTHSQVVIYWRFGLAGRANPLDLKVWKSKLLLMLFLHLTKRLFVVWPKT